MMRGTPGRRRLPLSPFVLGTVALAGLLAPWLAAYVLHLSPAEQHTALRFAGPGARDVPEEFPIYDGDKAAFARLDADGDGLLRCRLVPAMGPLSDAARARFAMVNEGLPIEAIARAFAGELVCPELDRWTREHRMFDLLVARNDADLNGRLSPSELIGKLPADVVDRYGALDLDGDGDVTHSELVTATRITRFSPARLLDRYDANRDLAISKAEFPGLPAEVTFWLGTDGRGRDLLVRLLYGARVSLLIGLLATLVALVIGVLWGAIAGYVGGRVDAVMMRVVDALYGLPFMFIVILLLVVAGRSTINLFIALGAVSWLSMARVVRGQVLSLRERDYVLAARALGATPWRILWRHIIPATAGPVVVYATLMIPGVILEEALLSFLGLGVQPPDASWGTLIAEGSRLMASQPWLIVFPALVLTTTLLALNFVGDHLRDRLEF